MTSGPDPLSDDDALLVRLSMVAAQVDPVPAAVLEAAEAAFGLRDLDAQLALLVCDSLIDTEGLVLSRGEDEPRMLSFESPGSAVEVEVTEVDRRCRLVGQVVGGTSGTLRVEHGEGASSVPVDEIGRFTLADVPAGHLRLSYPAADGATVVTSWVRV